MDMNNETNDTLWESCCLTIDRNAVKYFIQVASIGSIFTTSLVMLIMETDCISQRNWASLLTLSIGILCPSPRMT